MTDERTNGTRWGRMSMILVPALVLSGVMGYGVAAGAVASSFVAQASTATLVADSIHGEGLGIVALPNRTKDANGNVGDTPVARFGIAHAKVGGLCFAQGASLLGQPITLLVKATDNNPATDETELDGVILDATGAKGVIKTSGDAAVNKNGQDIALGGSGIDLGGTIDQFGLQAPTVEIRSITAKVEDLVIPNGFNTPSVKAKLVRGKVDCPQPGGH